MLRFFKETGSVANCVALVVFVAVFMIHYLWLVFFPEQDKAQLLWAPIPAETSWLRTYVESEDYWLGYSYSICAAFVILNIFRFRNFKRRSSKKMIVGGVAGTGILAGAGCFLIGCCGSPMLIVWLNLFGLKFLPLIKPTMAVLTTVTITVSLVWIVKKEDSK